MMEKKTVSRTVWDDFFHKIGVDMQPSLEICSWDLMKRLVARGMGIGVIPREYTARQLTEGEVFEVGTDPALPARSVGMLLPKNAPVPYALHCFIEYFNKEN